MDVIFDTATGQLSIDTGHLDPRGAVLRAMLDRHGRTIVLRGVEMRLRITANGSEIFDLHLPPEGVRYKQTNQDVLATGIASWLPDQQIEIRAWCRRNDGSEVTAEASFTAPRPAQPYPSWIWTGTRWSAPAERPEAGDWQWDEGALGWVAAEEED